MKLGKIRFCLLFVGLIVFSTSCGWWDSEHGACLDTGPEGKGIVFRLLDKDSRVNLIAAWGAKYDSEKVSRFFVEYSGFLKNVYICAWKE